MIDRIRDLLARPATPSQVVWRDRIVIGGAIVLVVLIVGYAAAHLLDGGDEPKPGPKPAPTAPVKPPETKPKALPGMLQVADEFSRDYLAWERGKIKADQIRHAAVELAVTLQPPRCTPTHCPPDLIRNKNGHIKLIITAEGNGATVGYWFSLEEGKGKKRRSTEERGTLLLTLRRNIDRGWEVVRLG